MKAIFSIISLFILIQSAPLFAQPYQFRVAATTHAIVAELNGMHYIKGKYPSRKGYLKAGAGLVYSDDSDESFKLFNGRLVMGSQWDPDERISCELGFKGIAGSIEKESLEGNVSSLAFFGMVSARVDQLIYPQNDIPVHFYTELAASPKILSFQDLDAYFETDIGVNVSLIDNAFVNLSYRYFSFDMEKDHRDWEISDGALYFGITINIGAPPKKKVNNSRRGRYNR